MHPTWKPLLEHPSSATSAEATDLHGALPELAVLRAEGPDAVTFLQGQLTCDVAAVDAGTSRLGAWCNPKGRIAVLFRLVRRGAGLDMVLPAALAEESRKRLGMYVLRAKVTLGAEPDRLCLWARGARAMEVLAKAVGAPPPTDENGATTAGDVSVVRLPGQAGTCLVLAPARAVPELWSALGAVSERAGADAFELDRVRAAEPAIVPATAGAFVPQMVNLELLDGVSFTKGCYIGQEVVARTQHLGKLKRRMFRARVGAESAPSPGDPIYGASESGGQSVGSVVRAAPAGDGARELLTVLRLDAVAAGELHLQQILGPPLELLELPYELDRPADA